MAESTLDWQFEEPDSERNKGERPPRHLLAIAVGASLLLHGAIATVLLLNAGDQLIRPSLSVVRINLVPTNPLNKPLQPEVIAEPAIEPEVINPEVVQEIPENEASIVEAAIPEPLAPPPSSEPEPDTVETSDPDPSTTASNPPARPVISLPSLEAVQESVQAVNADSTAGSWLYECNLLEEESGFRTCDKDTAADDSYREVERNTVYEALNPVRERSRTERSLRTVYANTPTVAAALNSNAIPEELSSYMLEQLEAATSVYTNNGTDRVQHIRRMVDRSAAAQQAERVLADPWVRGRAVELQQRKVHAN